MAHPRRRFHPFFAIAASPLLALLVPSSRAAEHALATARSGVYVAPESTEAAQSTRNFRIPKGWRVDVIAAEPHLANPVAFTFDEQERIYVVETFRHSNGVLDIRGRADWPSANYKRLLPPHRLARLAEEVLDADLACRTVEDRERMLRGYFGENAHTLEALPDRVRLLQRDPDGITRRATVFADGFNALADGLASGVLTRGGDVWFANIPHLWKLRDSNQDGVADERLSLHHGYGVRVGFLGHDLHGLTFGPDGRLYFTIGDRGASVTTREGTRLETPDSGAVFRCDPDGSHLELFATGLRNPQELVFDDLGNLWTGDNNSDGGDQARWTYLVEGADCGWHIGWQYLESPTARGAWNSEGMWRPGPARSIAHIIPALANIGAGPSGITYNFGTGLPKDLDRHFFMCDFRGGPSGIWAFSVQPQGAGYTVGEPREILWNALPTDVDLGPDGGLYWSDWVQGWEKTGKGRIYRMYDPAVVSEPLVVETRALLRADFNARPSAELASLLQHADQRVRQKAQFALAERKDLAALRSALATGKRHGRLHAVWGLWQLGRTVSDARLALIPSLSDPDAEIRGQAARALGDLKHAPAGDLLTRLLGDPEPRPRFFAAIAVGRLALSPASRALVSMIAQAGDQDPFLRHAAVMGLMGCATPEQLAALAAHPSPAVRVAATVSLRRLGHPALATFLNDTDPAVVLEAARAINDLPIAEALPDLARLASRDDLATPVLSRALNANLRVGLAPHAHALASVAARATAPESARLESLRLLAQFTTPSGRDHVTGLWRPLEGTRAPQAAAEALETTFPTLLNASPEIAAAAVETAGKIDAPSLRPRLKSLALDPTRDAALRRSALRALAEVNAPEAAPVVAALSSETNAVLRAEILRWTSLLQPAAALIPIRAALDSGATSEKQAALSGLAQVQGPEADALLTVWLDRAANHQTSSAIVLDLLESSQKRSSATVSAARARVEATLADPDLTKARRHLLEGGNADAGRRVFHEKEAVQCMRCHKDGGEGGVVGPDLAGLGARQTREYLLEAIVHPNATIAEGYENVQLELKDDTEISGTVQKETDTELILNTVENGAVTVTKSEIRDRRKGLSSMPEGFGELLTPRELRDLVEYLASLKQR